MKRFSLPETIKQYLTDIVEVTVGIIYSIQDLVSSNPSIDKSKAIDTHYQSLVKGVELYNRSATLDLKGQKIISEEIGKINEYLRKQIFVANILFDPEKREGEFRIRIWGNEFGDYIDRLMSH